ncbi:MAG TPA: hypothetical protein VK484_09805 [Ferruginibacter sp.]|nr:hypothetical protein [Ferruginibacter sp.]
MKRTQKINWLLVLVLFLGSSTSSFSQAVKDFFNNPSTPLTYLGIDYAKNKLINDPGGNAADIKGRLYASMNDVVIAEMPKNYNIAGAFARSGEVNNDISSVTARNEKINTADIMSSNVGDFNRLTEADIAAEVKALVLKDKQGVGLVFIMEGMKKEEKKSYGAVWVVLVDLKTKKVLMAERMEQEAAGFGFRNFWVSIIKKSLTEISKRKYDTWKTKYAG